MSLRWLRAAAWAAIGGSVEAGGGHAAGGVYAPRPPRHPIEPEPLPERPSSGRPRRAVRFEGKRWRVASSDATSALIAHIIPTGPDVMTQSLIAPGAHQLERAALGARVVAAVAAQRRGVGLSQRREAGLAVADGEQAPPPTAQHAHGGGGSGGGGISGAGLGLGLGPRRRPRCAASSLPMATGSS
jgi:hypothetical protein